MASSTNKFHPQFPVLAKLIGVESSYEMWKCLTRWESVATINALCDFVKNAMEDEVFYLMYALQDECMGGKISRVGVMKCILNDIICGFNDTIIEELSKIPSDWFNGLFLILVLILYNKKYKSIKKKNIYGIFGYYKKKNNIYCKLYLKLVYNLLAKVKYVIADGDDLGVLHLGFDKYCKDWDFSDYLEIIQLLLPYYKIQSINISCIMECLYNIGYSGTKCKEIKYKAQRLYKVCMCNFGTSLRITRTQRLTLHTMFGNGIESSCRVLKQQLRKLNDN